MCIGGLIGSLERASIVNNNSKINIDITSSGRARVGGLVGYLYSNDNSITIEKSYAIGNIKLGSDVIFAGGLVGYSYGRVSINISNSKIDIEGATSGYKSIGGLVGYSNGNTITKSYAIGNIKIGSDETNAGGLIGESYSTNINDAYAVLEISEMETCKNTSKIGGIVGNSNTTQINNTYVIGKIDITNGQKGALIGNGRSTVTNSYYSSKLTDENVSSAGECKKLEEMLWAPSYIGWNFDTIWSIDRNGESLPYLKDMQKPTEILKENLECEETLNIEYSGSGTKEDPFIIDSIQKLQNINLDSDSIRKNAYYLLACDLDCSELKTFEPIGTNTSAFTGTLDGNGHKISNLNIDSENQYVGLFGYIKNGTIKNLTLENETIKGNSTVNTYIGGLVGYSESSIIEEVRTIGENKIEDSSAGIPCIGGMIGYQSIGIVRKSYVEGEIVTISKNSNGNIGGIIGYIDGSAIVEESNSKITIENNQTGVTNIGGVIGTSKGLTIESRTYN